MTTKFHRTAAKELAEAVEWYDERSEFAGDKLLEDFRRTLELILRHPFAGYAVSPTRRKVLFTTFPYYIGYRIIGDTIRILAIGHTSRRDTYWRRRT